jgi:hypothetical protein
MPAVSVMTYWEWPPAALLVAGPLIETRANGSLGKDVSAWLPTEGNVCFGDLDVRTVDGSSLGRYRFG